MNSQSEGGRLNRGFRKPWQLSFYKSLSRYSLNWNWRKLEAGTAIMVKFAIIGPLYNFGFRHELLCRVWMLRLKKVTLQKVVIYWILILLKNAPLKFHTKHYIFLDFFRTLLICGNATIGSSLMICKIKNFGDFNWVIITLF